MSKKSIIVICAVVAVIIIIWVVVANRGGNNGNNNNVQTTVESTTESYNNETTTEAAVNDNISNYLAEQDNIMHNMMTAMMNTENSGSADIDFLAGMIPHHESAIEMAESYMKYGPENDEMKKLAENIIITQSEEINQMNDFIKSIKESGVTDENNEEKYLEEYNQIMHNNHTHSERNYNNVDMAFAEGMIEHHQMAVDMADLILKYGSNEDVRKLAENIIDAQKKEIEEMNNFLNK